MTLPLADPERRLALAYVPAARRAAVAALWTLDERLGGIVLAAREPMIGRIRLAWWRDALAALDEAPPPGEPLLGALAGAVLPGVSGVEMAGMVAGWDVLLPLDAVDEAAVDVHARERGELLFAFSGRLLGGVPPAGAGALWAVADLARIRMEPGAAPVALRGGVFARKDGASGHPAPNLSPQGEGSRYRWPRPLRPLGMLAILAARDPGERQGSPARMFAMLRHRLTGR